jgi:hypothetical protein
MAIFAILIRNIHTNLMNLSTRLVVGLLSLCVPFAVAAAAPGNVTGIKASLQGGKVLVTWTPVTDQHSRFCRAMVPTMITILSMDR